MSKILLTMFLTMFACLLFMLFGVVVPQAFTAPLPEQVQYVVIGLPDSNLAQKYYVKDYPIEENKFYVICGYWDEPDYIMWDTGWDWVGHTVKVSTENHIIKAYPEAKATEGECQSPCTDCSEPR